MKQCSCCGMGKSLDEFYSCKRIKSGKVCICKTCWAAKGKAKYSLNKREILDKQKLYYQKNKERISERTKQYAALNSDKLKASNRDYYQRNKSKMLQDSHDRYFSDIDNNRKKARERCEKFTRVHPGRRNEIAMKYYHSHKDIIFSKAKKRFRYDSKYRINNLMSCQIRLRLKSKKGGETWENLVGYTAIQLEKRLRRTMPEGYTWQDFLDGKLHIDHKIPVAVFNFNCPDDPDFKRCFAISNLQLLPALQNIKKGKKIDKPFQPCLSFGKGN